MKDDTVVSLRVENPMTRISRVLVTDGVAVDAFGIVAVRAGLDEVLELVKSLGLSKGWLGVIEEWRSRSEEYAVLVAPSPTVMFYGRPLGVFVDDPCALGVEMAKLAMTSSGGSFSWRIMVNGDAHAKRSVHRAWLAEAYLSGRA